MEETESKLQRPESLMLLPPGTRDRLRWAGASQRYVISLEANFVDEVADTIKPGLAASFQTHWNFRDEPLRELLAEVGREAVDGWPLGALYADLLGLSLSTLLLRRYATSPAKLPFVRGGQPMQSIRPLSNSLRITCTRTSIWRRSHRLCD